MTIVVSTSAGDTLSTLLSEFYLRGFHHMNDSGTEAARATRWCNQSIAELNNLAPWPWLYATTTGTAPITLSARNVLSVTDTTNDAALQGFTREYLLDQVTSDLTTTGTATNWYLDGSVLRVYPVSTSQTLEVRYLSLPTDLAVSTDVCSIPKRYTNLVVDLMVLRGYRSTDALEPDASLRGEVDRQVQDMMGAELVRGESEYVRVLAGAEDW